MDCIALVLHISIRPAYIYTLQHCVVGFSCFIACLFVEMRQTQPFSTQSLIGVKIIFMLIRNLRSLFDGLEPPTGRLESVLPDVIAQKEDATVIIPEKFKDDIQRLISYCGVELRSGLCIEIELSELLEILPRERRRKDAYDKLVKFLAEEMNIKLNIKSRNYENKKKTRLR